MGREIEAEGDYIRERRQALGKRQRDIAKAAGITQAQLSRIERGWPTTYPTVERIAEVLGVEVGRLLKKMPGDVGRGSDDLMRAWLDLIEGKTRELREGMQADDLAMDAVLGADGLHKDVTMYAGSKLGLVEGDSRISLALDELMSTVEEAYPVAVKLALDRKGSVEKLRVKEEGRKKMRVRKSA